MNILTLKSVYKKLVMVFFLDEKSKHIIKLTQTIFVQSNVKSKYMYYIVVLEKQT